MRPLVRMRRALEQLNPPRARPSAAEASLSTRVGELPDRPPVAEMDPNLSVKAGHSEETLMELRMQAFAEHGFVSLLPP